MKKNDLNKLKSNTDKKSISELIDRAHKNNVRMLAWKDVSGKRETIDVFVRTIRKSRNEFEIHTKEDETNDLSKFLVVGKKINLYVPDLAVLLQAQVSQRENEAVAINFPEMVAHIERRSHLRLNLVESVENEVRCFFYKSMSSKFLGTVVQTQYFERACHDISAGGLSFVLPKPAEKYFSEDDSISQIFVCVEGEEITVDARIVAKVPIEPTRDNKLHYKGVKICLEFTQIEEEQRETLENFVFKNIKLDKVG